MLYQFFTPMKIPVLNFSILCVGSTQFLISFLEICDMFCFPVQSKSLGDRINILDSTGNIRIYRTRLRVLRRHEGLYGKLTGCLQFDCSPITLTIYCFTAVFTFKCSVKPVLSSHSKRRPKIVFKTNYRLMQVKSIAECSKRAFCNTFDLH